MPRILPRAPREAARRAGSSTVSRWAQWCGAAAAVALVGAASSTRAEPRPAPATPLVLSWSAPAGCPPARAVEAEVLAILGAAPHPGPELLATVVVVESGDGRYEAMLGTRRGGAAGERHLTGEDCAELAHAAALVLALMLTPGSEPATRAPVPAPAQAPTPGPSTEPPPAPSAPPAPASGWPALARGTVVVGAGALPGTAVGGGLHLGVAHGTGSVELRLEAWLPKTVTSVEQPRMGADLWMLTAAPALCLRGRPGGGVVRLDGCAALETTHLRARGFGMSNPGRAVASWGALVAEAGVALRLSGRVGLRGAAEVSRPLVRPRFAIENVGELHRPACFGVGGGLAVELGF